MQNNVTNCELERQGLSCSQEKWENWVPVQYLARVVPQRRTKQDQGNILPSMSRYKIKRFIRPEKCCCSFAFLNSC